MHFNNYSRSHPMHTWCDQQPNFASALFETTLNLEIKISNLSPTPTCSPINSDTIDFIFQL